MDLLLRAHELHAVLGPSGHQTQPTRFKRNQNVEPYCFKCSHPSFTSRSCPRCNTSHHVPKSATHSGPMPPHTSPLTATLDTGEPRTEAVMPVEATLDTGASLSAVQADLVRVNDVYPNKTHQWACTPLSLADNASCTPDGVTWLPIGFMNKHFYQRFTVIPNVSSPFILRLIRASLMIPIPSRTVLMDDVLCLGLNEDGNDAAEPFIDRGTIMLFTNLCEKLPGIENKMDSCFVLLDQICLHGAFCFFHLLCKLSIFAISIGFALRLSLCVRANFSLS